MSDLLQSANAQGRQPEPHPDADELSAFIENVLPAHDRAAVLAHLAVCGECRETVALSLPPAEAPQVAVTPPAQKRWFSPWSVFLPAAAALAGLGAFILYVNRPPRPAQTAQNRTLSAHAAAPQPGAQLPSTSLLITPSENRQEAARRKMGLGKKHMSEQSARHVESPNSLIVGRQLVPGSEESLRGPKDETGHPGAVMGTIHGSALGGGSAGNEAAKVFASPGPALDEKGLMAPRPKTAAAQLSAAALPDSPAIKAAARSAETVNVSTAQPALALETTSANVDTLTMEASEAQAATFERALPSRLNALSVAAHGRQLLAIDLHNSVFVSGDSGGHWKTVSVPWRGRAVKASVATPIPVSQAEGGVAGGGVTAFAAAAAPEAKAMNATLAGQVTDVTGASISNATVVIFDSSGQPARTLKTDAEGRYAAIGLPGGSYNIEAQAPGFEVQRVWDVAVGASPATENLALRVGAATESVTVEGAPQSGATRPAVQFARAKSLAAVAPAIFEITTDNGERWTSADGLTWQRK